MNEGQEYQIEDLLQDEKFLDWCNTPTPELEVYWNKRIEECPELLRKINDAKLFLNVLSKNEAVLTSPEVDEMWKHIDPHAQQQGKRRWFAYGSVAAGFLLLLTASWFLASRDKGDVSSGIEWVGKPAGKVTDIQLVFADEKVKTIAGKEIEVQYDADGQVKVNAKTVDSILLNKAEDSLREEEVQYNQLIVPLGKRSSIVFADGSKIWVNAGSRVVYPVGFAKQKREIFVEGEVFLEVTRNENCPFHVKTHQFEVTVLGTSFNVSAYENETNPSVVLVTGKVNVRTKEKQELRLTPNDMFVYDRDKSYVRLVEVYDYIAWKDGLYRFESARLTTILERISRYYGKKFKINPKLETITCSGKLDLKDDFNELLEGLTKTVPIRYQLKDDMICVEPQ